MQKQAGGTPLIPTLEANAYGLGDVAVAQLLAGAGIKTVAVSRLEEAVRIAENVRGMDILLLTPYAGEEDIATILKNDIIAAVGSNDSAVLISSLSRKLRCRARVQLCFDFGMGRFGYMPQDVVKAAQTIHHLENVELYGVFTVLPAKIQKEAAALQQVKDFQRVLTAIEREGLRTGIAHMADSSQAAQFKEMRLGAVRAGADLFGRGPQKERHGLKKVGRAVSEVCDIKWMTAGSTVGEDGRLPAPAGDPAGGGSRRIGGRRVHRRPDEKAPFLPAQAVLRNQRQKAPVIGQVGLTSLTADVTSLDCAPGDIVSFEADPVGISVFTRREYV